jgi:hypothetical protein
MPGTDLLPHLTTHHGVECAVESLRITYRLLIPGHYQMFERTWPLGERQQKLHD